ncbi:MAG: hypothetical protein R2724_00820 [Bryobacterales bacterium]
MAAGQPRHPLHEYGPGDAALLILPDGTTLQFDAGDGGWPIGSPRGVKPRPDASRPAGAWIARYARRVLSHFREPGLDYALLSHLHGDHMNGFPDLGRQLPIGKMLDRAWPSYDTPFDVTQYEPAAEVHRVRAREPGAHGALPARRKDQIKLLRAPGDYPDFEIRNIMANGEVWTGEGEQTRHRFPDDWRSLPESDQPNENMSSLGSSHPLRQVRLLYRRRHPRHAAAGIPGVAGHRDAGGGSGRCSGCRGE